MLDKYINPKFVLKTGKIYCNIPVQTHTHTHAHTHTHTHVKLWLSQYEFYPHVWRDISAGCHHVSGKLQILMHIKIKINIWYCVPRPLTSPFIVHKNTSVIMSADDSEQQTDQILMLCGQETTNPRPPSISLQHNCCWCLLESLLVSL